MFRIRVAPIRHWPIIGLLPIDTKIDFVVLIDSDCYQRTLTYLKDCGPIFSFYPRDAMLVRYLTSSCVCLSIWHKLVYY